ncbi:MAG: hypothetical protein KA201_16415 [Kofleriaceae bacterium]|nr:hypothetical protein [Kofleriaceae bacterium]
MLVARRDVVDRLVADLAADAGKQTQRHWQLIGPRGSGKSHLTQLIALRLEAEHGWVVARLPEEHYQVGSVGDLLEQVVMRLEQVDVSPLADVSRADLEERALDRIRALRASTGKPVLVVIENLAILFERQLRDRRSQQRLRQILGKNPPFALVATSTSYVDATVQHAAPFYDFFQVVFLDDLTSEEVVMLIEARIRRDRQPAPSNNLGLLRARARAMYHFSGGNPRLVLVMYAALAASGGDPLHAGLLTLLDEVTPYFQARLAELAPQTAVVLAALAVSAPGQSPSDVARACRLPTNQLTAQLAKLERGGLVRAVGRGADRRRRHYQVAERLLRIWLAWRERATPDDALAALAAFFERWYEAHAASPRGDRAAEATVGWGWIARGAVDERGIPYSTAAEVRADPGRAATLAPELREAVELLLGAAAR